MDRQTDIKEVQRNYLSGSEYGGNRQSNTTQFVAARNSCKLSTLGVKYHAKS